MNEIIVGIDTGTTTAIAILDLKGRILFLKSKREYKISEIVEDILRFGKPILICTDKEKVPKKVKKIASLFSCKIFHPTKNPSRIQKYRITKNFEYRNYHERDAIFSAIKGFKSLRIYEDIL
jgi:predicted RNase H-like nuclease (RuvC/YqgF family)